MDLYRVVRPANESPVLGRSLPEADPEVAAVSAGEDVGPLAVMQARGSVLTGTCTDVHLVLVDLRASDLVGTPALATRGFDEGDVAEVADVLATALPGTDDELAGLRERVAAHPLHPERTTTQAGAPR